MDQIFIVITDSFYLYSPWVTFMMIIVLNNKTDVPSFIWKLLFFFYFVFLFFKENILSLLEANKLEAEKL